MKYNKNNNKNKLYTERTKEEVKSDKDAYLSFLKEEIWVNLKCNKNNLKCKINQKNLKNKKIYNLWDYNDEYICSNINSVIKNIQLKLTLWMPDINIINYFLKELFSLRSKLVYFNQKNILTDSLKKRNELLISHFEKIINLFNKSIWDPIEYNINKDNILTTLKIINNIIIK